MDFLQRHDLIGSGAVGMRKGTQPVRAGSHGIGGEIHARRRNARAVRRANLEFTLCLTRLNSNKPHTHAKKVEQTVHKSPSSVPQRSTRGGHHSHGRVICSLQCIPTDMIREQEGRTSPNGGCSSFAIWLFAYQRSQVDDSKQSKIRKKLGITEELSLEDVKSKQTGPVQTGRGSNSSASCENLSFPTGGRSKQSVSATDAENNDKPAKPKENSQALPEGQGSSLSTEAAHKDLVHRSKKRRSGEFMAWRDVDVNPCARSFAVSLEESQEEEQAGAQKPQHDQRQPSPQQPSCPPEPGTPSEIHPRTSRARAACGSSDGREEGEWEE
eukprot:747602-Hanusia_phi.AAC.3